MMIEQVKSLLRPALAIGLLLSATTAPANMHGHGAPAAGLPSQQEVLRISKQAIGRQLGNHTLTDSNGNPVELARFDGKPLVVSLIYTSCAHVCPTITQSLATGVRKANEALGADSFHVVSIGFDTAVDTPQRMREFAARQGVDLPNWTFLSGDAATVAAIADTLGFSYKASPKGFDHVTQTTLLDAQGVVRSQVYGTRIELPALMEPLKQLVFGRLPEDGVMDDLVKKVRLFCTTYDPLTDRYRFDYSLFIGMFIGLLIIGGAATFVVRHRRPTEPA